MNLAQAIKNAKRVYICGNGGSAINAMHIANDLVSCGIKAHPLTADVATLTAIANDYGYENIFSRQIEVMGEEGDLLIVLSGSGRSLNISTALRAAAEKGMTSWAIFGAYNADTCANLAGAATFAGSTVWEAEEEQVKIGHQVMLELK